MVECTNLLKWKHWEFCLKQLKRVSLLQNKRKSLTFWELHVSFPISIFCSEQSAYSSIFTVSYFNECREAPLTSSTACSPPERSTSDMKNEMWWKCEEVPAEKDVLLHGCCLLLLWSDGSGDQVRPERSTPLWLSVVGGLPPGALSHVVFAVVDVDLVWPALVTHPLQAGAPLAADAVGWCSGCRRRALQPAICPTSLQEEENVKDFWKPVQLLPETPKHIVIFYHTPWYLRCFVINGLVFLTGRHITRQNSCNIFRSCSHENDLWCFFNGCNKKVQVYMKTL